MDATSQNTSLKLTLLMHSNLLGRKLVTNVMSFKSDLSVHLYGICRRIKKVLNLALGIHWLNLAITEIVKICIHIIIFT